MKKLLIVLSISLFSSQLLADTIKVSINGMVCAFCANGVEKKFKKIEKVKKINVSLEDRLVTVDFDGKIPLSDEKITEIITGAGYQVAGIERIVK